MKIASIKIARQRCANLCTGVDNDADDPQSATSDKRKSEEKAGTELRTHRGMSWEELICVAGKMQGGDNEKFAENEDRIKNILQDVQIREIEASW